MTYPPSACWAKVTSPGKYKDGKVVRVIECGVFERIIACKIRFQEYYMDMRETWVKEEALIFAPEELNNESLETVKLYFEL